MNNEMYTRDDFDTEEEYKEYKEYLELNSIGWEIMTIPVDVVQQQVIPAMEKAKAALTGDVVEELSNAIHWLEYSAQEKSYIQ